MLRLASLLIAATSLLLLFCAAPTEAHACGGCFAPVGQPSIVDAHRMVISVSDTETTLWDQFEYTGDPEDFVWVLPVADGEGVEIELAEQQFFSYLAQQTRVTLQGPFSSSGGGFGCSASDGGEARTSVGNITVYSQAVVGPYETAVIGGDDADSLSAWLTDNGYAIPSTLEPTLAHYAEQRMAFVVLRLSAQAGVSQIQPVRVTTPGAHVTFPLRMVAAGVGRSVSLELFIIAEGRWEAQNFPNAEVDESVLAYDAASNTFNYDELVQDLLAEDGARTWVTEFSYPVSAPPASTWVTYDEDGYHGPHEDFAVATRHMATDRPTVTRMRAELPVEALTEDLILQASERGPRPALYVAGQSRASAAPPFGEAPTPPHVVLFVLIGVFGLVGLGRGRRHRRALRTAGSV